MPTFSTKDYKAALRSRGARTASAGGFSVKNDNSFIVIFVIAMMVFIFFYGVSARLDLDKFFLGNGRGRGGGGILGLLIAGVAWYQGRDGGGLFKFSDHAITFVSGAGKSEILLFNIDYVRLTPGFLRTCTNYTALSHSRYVKYEKFLNFAYASIIVLWLVGIAMSERVGMAFVMLIASVAIFFFAKALSSWRLNGDFHDILLRDTVLIRGKDLNDRVLWFAITPGRNDRRRLRAYFKEHLDFDIDGG
ncbi:hypothetical protein [uncultured Campylobacter sp.]|uniref:hypothetical protein n=1 Tax=uncultured Campylobacter sp. TaxID=218934 RepID=UPI00261A0FC9|nr:hypothetical protein [uncultured Campylobacter sp.]